MPEDKYVGAKESTRRSDAQGKNADTQAADDAPGKEV
jgi:hypothetical protein